MTLISSILLALPILPILPLVQSASPPFRSQCLSFNPTLHLPNSTLCLLEYIPANTTLPLTGTHPTCNRLTQTIPISSCRIALTLPTSPTTTTILELFLPSPPTWSTRLLTTGNGGIDGCIKYEDMAYALDHNFAALGHNNGHNGTTGLPFLHSPDALLDFALRAGHAAVAAGKTLAEAFYARAPRKTYFLGCSGGGRQGVGAASGFPGDYDGVLIGAPALDFNYLSAWRARFYTVTGGVGGRGFVEGAVWRGVVHAEVLRQCDGLDGVWDGVLEDPGRCAGVFRAEALLCGEGRGEGEGGDCLTEEQVDVVRRVYSPLYGEDGRLLYPGLAPGAEAGAASRLLSGMPFPYSVDWYRYAVYEDPDWDPASWNVGDAEAAEARNPGGARTWPSELSAFRERGGRMLVYHGGIDQQITGFNTERWYDYLAQGMQASSEELDKFLRFFRVPGLAHCSGGDGAWQIGQNAAGASGTGYDAQSNMLKALVDWVENDKAPDTILGTKFVNDSAGLGVQSRRRHCRYPLQSTYVGGDAGVPESWACK